MFVFQHLNTMSALLTRFSMELVVLVGLAISLFLQILAISVHQILTGMEQVVRILVCNVLLGTVGTSKNLFVSQIILFANKTNIGMV